MTATPIPDLDAVVRHTRRVAQSRGRNLSAQDQEDIAQTALEKYLVAAAQDPPRNPEAWLERVIRNLVVDVHRKDTRVDPPHPDDREDPIGMLRQLGADLRTPSLMVASRELADEVLGLASWPERQVLELRFLEGLSSREVGERLGISANAVDQRVRQARLTLRRALEDRPDLLADLRRSHPHLYPADRRSARKV